MFKQAKNFRRGFRGVIWIGFVTGLCLAGMAAAESVADHSPTVGVSVYAGHDTVVDRYVNPLESVRRIEEEQPEHLATSVPRKLPGDEVPVVIGPDKKYVLIPTSMSALFGKNANKLAVPSDHVDQRAELPMNAFICMRVDDVIDYCDRHLAMLEEEGSKLNAELKKYHAAIATALGEQKRAIDANHPLKVGIDAILPLLEILKAQPIPTFQANIIGLQLQQERAAHLKREKELHRMLSESRERVAKLNESAKTIASAHSALTEASRALATSQSRINSIAKEIGSLGRLRAAVIASLETAPVAGEIESRMPSIANELIGNWSAVARSPDGGLATLEIQLDDRGWGKLVVPGSDGKPASYYRIFVEGNTLKVISEVTVGKVVEVDSRQLVIEHHGETVTAVR